MRLANLSLGRAGKAADERFAERCHRALLWRSSAAKSAGQATFIAGGSAGGESLSERKVQNMSWRINHVPRTPAGWGVM